MNSNMLESVDQFLVAERVDAPHWELNGISYSCCVYEGNSIAGGSGGPGSDDSRPV